LVPQGVGVEPNEVRLRAWCLRSVGDGGGLEGELLGVAAVVVGAAEDAGTDGRLVPRLKVKEAGHFPAEAAGLKAQATGGEVGWNGVVEVDIERGVEVGPMLNPRLDHGAAGLGVDVLVHGGDTEVGVHGGAPSGRVK